MSLNRDLKKSFIYVSGINRSKTILLSFSWYIFNTLVLVLFKVNLLLVNSVDYGGFNSFGTYILAYFVVFIPHGAVLSSETNEFFGVKFIDYFLLVVLPFFFHYILSKLSLIEVFNIK